MKIVYLFFASLLLGAASCTPEPIDIEVPQPEQKPVVAAQFYYDSATDQSVLAVTLSKTISATSPDRPRIDSTGILVDERYLVAGARLELITSQGIIELTEEMPGVYYAFNPELRNHEHCTIRAYNREGQQLVSAATEMMPETGFSSISLSHAGRDQYLDYILEDDEAKTNWYVVNYFVKQQRDSGNYNDPKYIARRLTEQTLSFDLFTDSDFKDGRLIVKRKLGQLEFDTVAAAVSNISQGYYQFLQTQKKYGLLVNQVRGEVINFPTNVTGGLGYFSLSRPNMKVLLSE